MSEETQQPAVNPAAEKPGFFKRMYLGATNFVTHSVGYIPRGIVFTAGLFAGSAILESATGLPLLRLCRHSIT